MEAIWVFAYRTFQKPCVFTVEFKLRFVSAHVWLQYIHQALNRQDTSKKLQQCHQQKALHRDFPFCTTWLSSVDVLMVNVRWKQTKYVPLKMNFHFSLFFSFINFKGLAKRKKLVKDLLHTIEQQTEEVATWKWEHRHIFAHCNSRHIFAHSVSHHIFG